MVCTQCENEPAVTPAYVGFMATCDCYDGAPDGNHSMYGHGESETAALNAWRETVEDLYGIEVSS